VESLQVEGLEGTDRRCNFRFFLTDSIVGDQLLGACVAFSCPAFFLVKEEARWFVHLNLVMYLSIFSMAINVVCSARKHFSLPWTPVSCTAALTDFLLSVRYIQLDDINSLTDIPETNHSGANYYLHHSWLSEILCCGQFNVYHQLIPVTYLWTRSCPKLRCWLLV